MGKQRKVGRINVGKNGTLNYTHDQPKKNEQCRPSVNAPAVCPSCEAGVLGRDLILPSESTVGLCVKFWTQMITECKVCIKRKPKKTFDCTKMMPVKKALTIVAKCEHNNIYSIDCAAAQFKSGSEMSQSLRNVSKIIRKLYKEVPKANRPKEIIDAMTKDLLSLSGDETIVGRDIVLFECLDGVLALSCNEVILGYKESK